MHREYEQLQVKNMLGQITAKAYPMLRRSFGGKLGSVFDDRISRTKRGAITMLVHSDALIPNSREFKINCYPSTERPLESSLLQILDQVLDQVHLFSAACKSLAKTIQEEARLELRQKNRSEITAAFIGSYELKTSAADLTVFYSTTGSLNVWTRHGKMACQGVINFKAFSFRHDAFEQMEKFVTNDHGKFLQTCSNLGNKYEDVEFSELKNRLYQSL